MVRPPAPDPLPPLSALLSPEGTLAVHVTPGASARRLVLSGGVLRVYVTEPPADGRATEAARVALAKAFGLAKGDIELLRGAASREKVFRIRVA
jgi:uncharacterized protein YggU (UPF0235/DUF167 family)